MNDDRKWFYLLVIFLGVLAVIVFSSPIFLTEKQNFIIYKIDNLSSTREHDIQKAANNQTKVLEHKIDQNTKYLAAVVKSLNITVVLEDNDTNRTILENLKPN